MGTVTRPVLRYHGGKFQMADWIVGHFPAHRVYVEPFCGAASVLLRKPRAFSEVVNDMNADVVNLFRVLRDPAAAKDLRNVIFLTPYSRDEYEAAFEQASDPIERARRFVVRSFMGHSPAALATGQRTGFRASGIDKRQAPAADWESLPRALTSAAERLRGVVVENVPALETIRRHDSEAALFYVDPPYVHETRREGQAENYSHEMTDGDHRELSAVLRRVRGMVVLSGYRCPLYDELFQDWARVDRQALADSADRRTESLWLSPSLTQQAQGGLF